MYKVYNALLTSKLVNNVSSYHHKEGEGEHIIQFNVALKGNQDLGEQIEKVNTMLVGLGIDLDTVIYNDCEGCETEGQITVVAS